MRIFGKPARRREKVFGAGRAVPLDRNAKARIWHSALCYTARMRRKGQHRGPLTRAYLDVLRALLWGFHNAHTGRCFPSYERIAVAAHVARATVARAIEALETAGVLTWENRLIRRAVMVDGLLGPERQIVPCRTSNAYSFHDPQSGPPQQSEPRRQGERTQRADNALRLPYPAGGNPPAAPKSQNQTETENQGFLLPCPTPGLADLDPRNPLHAALIRLGRAMAQRKEQMA